VAFENLLNLIPLHLYIKQEAINFNYKTSISKYNYIQRLSDENLLKELNLNGSLREADYMTPEYNFEFPFYTEIPTREKWTDASAYTKDSDLIYYTDGSKTEIGTGLGVHGSLNMSRTLPNHATVFQAETMAISQCAIDIINKGYRNQKITIFSDSQAAIKALNKNKITSKTVLECLLNFKKASKCNNEIGIVWIPAHVGHEGNEMADELAKRGANSTNPTNLLPCKRSLKNIKCKIKNWTTAQTNKNFMETFGVRHSKIILQNYNAERAEKILKLQRNEIKRLTTFYTGHGQFKSLMYNMNISSTRYCKFCGEPETAEHIMCNCPAYDRIKFNILGKHCKTLEDYTDINFETFRKLCQNLERQMCATIS